MNPRVLQLRCIVPDSSIYSNGLGEAGLLLITGRVKLDHFRVGGQPNKRVRTDNADLSWLAISVVAIELYCLVSPD
jgi:hypothetical protein